MHHHRHVDANRVTTEQSSNTLASLRGMAPIKNREECTMRLPHRLISGLGTLLIATLCAGAAAQAQAPAAGSNLPWGLPPLPPGIGPVEKFADISGTPQSKFLEGGAFDDQGNLWFVAIGTGWISYLTPEGKLVPVVNSIRPTTSGRPASRRAPV